VYLWVGRPPTDSDSDDNKTEVASSVSARFTAAKICAMRTTLSYCTGMVVVVVMMMMMIDDGDDDDDYDD